MRKGTKGRKAARQFLQDFGGERKTLVEIGSFAGEFAVMAAKEFQQVYAIDPWDFKRYADIQDGRDRNRTENPHPELTGPKVEGYFDHNTEGIDNIVKLKAYDYDVVDKFPAGSIDVVYIDSIHTYKECSLAACRWVDKIKKFGVLAGHDYERKAFPGVCAAVEALSDMLGMPFVRYKDSSWAIRLGPDN